MEDTSADASPYHSDSSEHYISLSETSVDMHPIIDWPMKPATYSVSRLPQQEQSRAYCRRGSNAEAPSERASKMDLHQSPSKHTMRLRTRRPLDDISAAQFHSHESQRHTRHHHSHSHPPPQTTNRRTTHHKPRLRSASAPSLNLKRRSEHPSRHASRKKPKGPLTGNPDDLEDWEWDDPIVRRLAQAVFKIREERNETMRRLEAIDAKIDALRQNLSGKERA